MSPIKAVWQYLCDWKNWITHGLVGVLFLALLIWVPVAWWIKLIVMALVVVLNCVRMVLSKKNKNKTINDIKTTNFTKTKAIIVETTADEIIAEE